MSHDSMQVDSPPPRRPEFTAAVMCMDNNLLDHNVESLKFLCQKLVIPSQLKRVKATHELATCLQKVNLVSDDDFFLLADLLQFIKRVDVLESIGYREAEVLRQRHVQASKVEPFLVLLFHIAEDLNEEDLKKARYKYGHVPGSQKLSSGLDLFAVMIEHGAIDRADVSQLRAIFQALERQDIVKTIDRYTQTEGQSVMEDIKDLYRRKSLGLLGGCRGTTQSVSNLPSQQPSDLRDRNGSTDVPSNGRARSSPLPCSSAVSEHSSQENHRLSTLQAASSHASLSGSSEASPLPPTSIPEACTQGAEHHGVPNDFDERIISWQLLDALSKKIPAQHWASFISRLGLYVETQNWVTQKTDHTANMAVLKRWLLLPETQAMDSVRARLKLVEALHCAGPTLLAQEVAERLNVNIACALQESMSCGASVHDTNAMSSTGPARHIPDDRESQTESVGEAEREQGLPMATSQGAHHGQEPSASSIPHYRMDRKPRGHCVIINNKNFYADQPHAKKLDDRHGTDVDKGKLEDTFEKLDFKVITKDNCTDTQMIHIMMQMAAEDHRRFDCFICCILSHGSHGGVYGTNGISVPIRDLTSPFRSQACPSLADKPKLFFLQACQGNKHQGGQAMDIQRDCNVETDGPPERIPNEADFLLGGATIPGYVAFRSRMEGSWYITKLTEILNECAYSDDILEILTRVNGEVGKENAWGVYKQSPAPMYTLRKKLVFGHPGETSS